MASEARARKLADRVREIVAEALEMRVKDPRLGFITVTDARVTPDLREATVFYTVYGDDEARAAACFELGDHLRRTVSADAAVPWWKEAHRLDPFSLAYKRQAWTLVTTPEGADAPDLMQGPNDVYDTNLVDTVVGGGGFKAFIVRPHLDGL